MNHLLQQLKYVRAVVDHTFATRDLVEEFFNQVDKIVQERTKENPLPFILVTEERNRFHYEKVTDKNRIIGHMNQNRDGDKAQNIVKEAWKIVKKLNEERIRQRNQELRDAVFLDDEVMKKYNGVALVTRY